MNLKQQLIRLGAENPRLQSDISSVLEYIESSRETSASRPGGMLDGRSLSKLENVLGKQGASLEDYTLHIDLTNPSAMVRASAEWTDPKPGPGAPLDDFAKDIEDSLRAEFAVDHVSVDASDYNLDIELMF